MKLLRNFFWFSGTISFLCLTANNSLVAQIIPDTTLPNNSIAIPNGNTIRIEGGTTSGSNLFHSFQEFSVPIGNEAFFNNSLDIQNIFSRVTGSNISNIDGLIRANSTANLFLINPNGIIFGQNAQLNIGGSFIGSTASSIRFVDGSEFSASNPTAPSLLTINVPIGLQFGANPKSITNISQATSLIPLPPLNLPIPIPTNVGLQVQPGQTLALVGGDVILNNGNLTAFQGEIHLGSVASPGLVGFYPTATGTDFDYTGVASFGKIELSGTASVNTSGFGGGAIRLRGENVTLRDRSSLISDTIGNIDSRDITIQAARFQLNDKAFIETATLATGNAGNILIGASDLVELRGSGFETFRRLAIEEPIVGRFNPFPRESSIFSSTLSAGKAGNISIDTRQLTLQEGIFIGNPTFNLGSGGNLAIRASESVEVVGSGLYSTTTDRGNGGQIEIDTQRLSIRQGAIVTTITGGQGRGGDIMVRASDSVIVSENRPDSPLATSFGTNSFNSTGNSGNIEINTRSLLVERGGAISSGSGLIATTEILPGAGQGGNITINATDSVRVVTTTNADSAALDNIISRERRDRSIIASGVVSTGVGGELTINTRQLVVEDGSAIATSTLGSGSAGNISINASESLEVKGTTSVGRVPATIVSGSGEFLYGTLFQLPPPTGAAGNISIITPRSIVRDGATVSVTSLGTGQGGNINLVADSIELDNGGSIDASVSSGAGGNINLQAQNIQLRQLSRIRTDADNATGGNIDINTDTLAALANSDITANAQQGTGGRVSITAQGIFGTQFRDELTTQSDITATSELGAQFSGTVEINTPDVDPSSGLVELSANYVDVSDRIASACPAEGGNAFVVTGRGGIPSDPTQTLRASTVWRDVRSISSNETARTSLVPQTNYQQPIAEATSWTIDRQGRVELIANDKKAQVSNPWNREPSCGV